MVSGIIPSPRLRLEEWGRAIPGLWHAVEAQRAERRPDSVEWPAPVFLPLERAGAATLAAILAAGQRPPDGPAELSAPACTTQCLAAWRMTQGIYRIDPTLYEALIATPIAGDIPADVLLYLPEWCVYIETPGMTAPAADREPLPVAGLWYWLDSGPGREMALCIGIDLGRRPPIPVQHVPLIGTLDAALNATVREWADAVERGNAARPPPPGYREAARAWLPAALSLVLYLCSRAADIDGRPGNPAATRTRRGERLFPASGPRRWEVGVRLGAALRAAWDAAAESSGSDATGARRPVRPHVRGAHWHTYLRGPRKDVPADSRPRELRWLPPIPVAVEDYDALPAVVRPVKP
ncbi:MAG TPA: hypothetical protein VFA12_20430 [Stellaceae bacterium]|nr:hypothetical protein [Stellaceae bacterium]